MNVTLDMKIKKKNLNTFCFVNCVILNVVNIGKFGSSLRIAIKVTSHGVVYFSHRISCEGKQQNIKI